jgi:hypothetical protein
VKSKKLKAVNFKKAKGWCECFLPTFMKMMNKNNHNKFLELV